MKNIISNELLLLSVVNFYKMKNDYLEEILPIIFKTSSISLRLIDWFVTNYCKKYNIILIQQKADGTSYYFNVYSNYRSQLKAFKKIKFDPFRRRERIKFYYDETNFVETTIGQLNFFRWFVENGLLIYIQEHYLIIEKDMNVHQKDSLINKVDDDNSDKKDSKTRKHLSKSMLKKMTKFNGSTTISFY